MGPVKALVLARGRGRRMREPAGDVRQLSEAQRAAARAGWKALMPVAGRPFLDFVRHSLADAGCLDVALVIGPEQRAVVQEYQRAGRTARTRVALVEQAEPLGTADAVRSAAEWLEGSPFLVVNGDNLYPTEALRDLIALDGPGLAVFDAGDLVASSNIPVERIAEFATVWLTPAGDLASIVEKPSVPGPEGPGLRLLSTDGAPDFQVRGDAQRLVSMNAWRFDRRIIDACRDVGPSSRGEYELPEAVALAMARGVRFTAVRARGAVLDLSRQTDITAVAQRLSSVEPRP